MLTGKRSLEYQMKGHRTDLPLRVGKSKSGVITNSEALEIDTRWNNMPLPERIQEGWNYSPRPAYHKGDVRESQSQCTAKANATKQTHLGITAL